MMKYYFITYQRNHLSPNGERSITLKSFTTDWHPFKWLAHKKHEETKSMENQTGTLHYTMHTLVFWKEISEQEYKMSQDLNLYE